MMRPENIVRQLISYQYSPHPYLPADPEPSMIQGRQTIPLPGETVAFFSISICRLFFQCDIIWTRVFKIGSQDPFCKRISVRICRSGIGGNPSWRRDMGRKRTTAWKYVYICAACLTFLSFFSCAGIKQAFLRKEAQEHLSGGEKLLAQKNYDAALNEFRQILSLHPPKPLEEEALYKMGLVYAHFGNPKRDYGKSLNLFLKLLNDYPESRLSEQSKIWVGVLQANLETAKNLEKVKSSMRHREEGREGLKEPRKTRQGGTGFEESEEGRQQLFRSQKLLAQGNYEGAAGEGQKLLASSDPRSSKDEALFNLGLIYAHSRNPQRDIEKSLEYFKRLIKNYPKSPFVDQAKIWVGILEENEELNYLIQKLKQVDIDIEEMKRNRPQ